MTDTLLYTGIPFETYNTLVSTLEMFASSAFTIPVSEQGGGPWLPEQMIQATMPVVLKKNFPNTSCIWTIVRPSYRKPNMDSRGESY